MSKKLSIALVLLLFLLSVIFLIPHDNIFVVKDVISPVEFSSGKETFKYNDLDYFDFSFTKKNKTLADKLGMSEEEAFIIGNLGKYWADKLMRGRMVSVLNDKDLVYLKYSYRERFYNSGFCLKNSAPCNKDNFEKILDNIRKSAFYVLDYDTENIYKTSAPEVRSLKNYIVLRKFQIPKNLKKKSIKNSTANTSFSQIKSFGDVKIFYTDETTKLKPDRSCSTGICREILTNINKSKNTIDMAIYGYSRTPDIETALKNALKRGVKIRLVYDLDGKSENIYPDTSILTDLIKDNRSDFNSAEAKNLMHNKFYIFDDTVTITGSANLAHTDMSGFNSNSIVVINSPEIAKIYKTEFEQMYNGKFHNDKVNYPKNKISLENSNLNVCFSPQDKCIANYVVPLINKAEKYVYIPTFVLTDKNVANALINAEQRGVDVRIIVDALNASVQHSKHKELRAGNVKVKTENYAGKMHSKSIIADDKYTIIGSMNFSNSGENRNDENMVIIESNEIAQFYKQFFLYQWNKIDNRWLTHNARAEGKDSIGSCFDGIDNNYDGYTDKDDIACK